MNIQEYFFPLMSYVKLVYNYYNYYNDIAPRSLVCAKKKDFFFSGSDVNSADNES